MRFTTILASRIINNAILPLDSEDRANVLIIDDSMFERNRSKKVELLAKVYDHAKHKYRFGFRMLTPGWSDGSTFLPVNSILLSTENKKNRINEAAEVDKNLKTYCSMCSIFICYVINLAPIFTQKSSFSNGLNLV